METDNPYFNKNGITLRGKDTLERFGLNEQDLISMSSSQLARYTVSFSDVLNDGDISVSTKDKTKHAGTPGASTFTGNLPRVERVQRGDSGSFSRYFDLDKWWNERIKDLPTKVRKTFPFLIVPKSSKSEKDKGLNHLKEKIPTHGKGNEKGGLQTSNACLPKYNFHPTCKPIDLMSYLIILGSREGDVILDPFMGSASTLVAAHLMNRKWIGIEKDEEYFKIAEARMNYIQQQLTLF